MRPADEPLTDYFIGPQTAQFHFAFPSNGLLITSIILLDFCRGFSVLHRFVITIINFNSSNGRVVRARASALGAVDLDYIPNRVKPMTLKLAFTASLLDAQH